MKHGFIISFLMLLVVKSEFGSTQHLIPQQQFYQASNTPSHTATLGQAYQQQPTIRAYQQPQPQLQAAAPQQLIRYAAPVAAPAAAAAAAVAAPQGIPSSYGWQVQHAAQQPQPQPQPQHLQQPQQQLIQQQVQPQLIQQQQPQPQLIRYAPAQAVAARQLPVAQPAQQYIQPQILAAQALAQQRQLVQYANAGPTVAARQIQVAPLQTQIIGPQTLASPVAQQQQYAVAGPTPTAAAPSSPLHRPASVHYASIGENLAGDYKFGYRTGDGNSFREEARLPDGTVQGQYGFVDADGKQRVVKYMAGVGGYQVLNGEGAAPAPQARAAAPAPQVIVPQWAQSQIGAAPSPPQAHQAAAAGQILAPQQYAQAIAAAPQQQSVAPQAWGTHLG